VENDPVNFVDPSGLLEKAFDAAVWGDWNPYDDGWNRPTGGGTGYTGRATSDAVAYMLAGGNIEQWLLQQSAIAQGEGSVPRPMDPTPQAPTEMPPPAREHNEDTWADALKRARDCLGKAFEKRYGPAVAGSVLSIVGMPIPKNWVPPYRSIGAPYTTILSVVGHYIEVNVPRLVWGELATTNLLRFGGRAAGPIGWALLALDVGLITADTWNCYKQSEGTEKKAP
jgi:hypothetical protein